MPNKNITNQLITPKNPCFRCDLPETECNMIGCQECQNWLHNKCDPEVNDDEGAASIEYYYCPPCRDKGFELVKYQIIPSDEESQKLNHGEEEDNVDYAEDALQSPLLTPNQKPPDEDREILEESNHDLTQLINSFPDPVRDDPNYKIKEIVEKIKNVSISKEKKKSPQKKKPRKMIHRSREEILKENTKLTKIIEKITSEKEKAEENIKEMEKALKIDAEYRSKMEKLEENLKSKDETTIERVIYEAENCKQAQDKKIKDLQIKIEESRKKNIDKQNEIKEIKKYNEECLMEINSLKTSCEKETDLRTKAEELLRLTEEKTVAQEAQITECSKNHTVQILNLKKQVEDQKQTEKLANEEYQAEIKKLTEKERNDSTRIKELEKQNTLLKLKIETPNHDPSQPNVLDDNVEMVQIINSLESQLNEAKEENHALTVKVVENEVELKLRKELLNELNETYGKQIQQLSTFHSNHLEKVSQTYIQKILQHQKEAVGKPPKTIDEHENNLSESQTVQKLTKQLHEKTEE